MALFQVKELAKGWGALPARYQMVVATSLAFVLCNMDKVGPSMLMSRPHGRSVPALQ